jgi:hypothetical protein
MKLERNNVVPFAAAALAIACVACGASDPGPATATGMERVWYEELAVLAEERLGCSRDDLEYRYLGDRVHLLRGCGQEVRYLIFQLGEVWIKVESFHAQAAFDLQCDAARLAARRLSDDRFAVSGCGRELTYVLRCEADGITCDWRAAE